MLEINPMDGVEVNKRQDQEDQLQKRKKLKLFVVMKTWLVWPKWKLRPILGKKKGRAEDTNSSKMGNDRNKKEEEKKMEEDGQGAHDPNEPLP